MIVFRDRGARGRHHGGQLEARYSFSFGSYLDPKHMGFRDLRVLNEDWIVPGAGFPEHGHDDMEIITIVLKGVVEHRDDLGNVTIIPAGDVQRMSAGTGIRHSERNPHPSDNAHALQIWIIPSTFAGPPAYGQRSLGLDLHRNRWLVLASGDGRDDSLLIRQDAALEMIQLDDGARIDRETDPERGYWLQLVSGLIGLNGTEMREGDGAAITDEARLTIEADTDAQLLLIDLP